MAIHPLMVALNFPPTGGEVFRLLLSDLYRHFLSSRSK
jgi:hypothetical protein